MKRILLALAVVALGTVVYAGTAALVMRLSQIGPTTSTANVTITAPATGIKNCLTDIDVVSDNTYDLNILQAGTTIYHLTLSSGTAIVRSWDDQSALCAPNATAMYINVSAGNARINYGGYTR